MKATISLEASDLLKIARLVHDTPHKKNDEYVVSYYSDGITLTIELIDDLQLGYCINSIEAYVRVEYDNTIDETGIEVPEDLEKCLTEILNK